MKVLQVNCVYATGSTGRLTEAIHTHLLLDGDKSVVCYGRGKACTEKGVYKICSELYAKAQHARANVTGIMYGGCWSSTQHLISIIRKEKPDIVHLQCINGYFVNIYRLIEWLKKNEVKTVLTLHADFMFTANCGIAIDCDKWLIGCGNCPRLKKETGSLFYDRTALSWNRMQEAFNGAEKNCTVVSVSPWLRKRAERAPILKNFRHVTIENGVDTEIFTLVDAKDLRQRYDLECRKLVLHVTASFSLEHDSLKGGWYIIELAKRMPDVTFVVIGNRTLVDNLPDNVLCMGRTENQHELAAWYCAADVTLLTSQRETFSLVTAESLCCGTPVVGFRAGGPESIVPPSSSEFVEYGDMDALENALRSRLETSPEHATLAADAAAKFNMENMYYAYRDEYKTLFNEL